MLLNTKNIVSIGIKYTVVIKSVGYTQKKYLELNENENNNIVLKIFN